MSKRTTFTTISPLPPHLGRQAVLDFLHDHEGMIDLNPLVIERHPLPVPPPHCPDEERQCVWWSMTDKIAYAPGIRSELTYTAAFQDLPDGIRTHCYAPMGTHILERWSLGGTLPGEPPQPVELGSGAPAQGLYLREEVEVRCNFLMAGFVKKTILKAHGVLVERLVEKASSSAATTTSSHPSGALRHDGYSGGDGSISSDGRESSVFDARQSTYSTSESGSVPESLRTGRASEQFSGHARQGSGQQQQQRRRQQSWQAQPKPYVHDPYNPHNSRPSSQQAPQIPPLQLGGGQSDAGWTNEGGRQEHDRQSAPIAELPGSETHIAELQ